jgi:ABC-type polar amino acid transport system ATPase subunit
MLRIENLSKAFDGHMLFEGVSLTAQSGEIVALAGPSGIGKTTFIRCINFLERPDSGSVTVDDLTLDARTATRQDICRLCARCGMVFQDYALFKHRTALQNVMEAQLAVLRRSRAKARERAIQALERVEMAGYADRYPSQLSGGQQQRVAIARAAAMDPSVLLMDEPTSALDPELTDSVVALVRGVADAHRTVLVVTHDAAFARKVSDRILVMENGKLSDA